MSSPKYTDINYPATSYAKNYTQRYDPTLDLSYRHNLNDSYLMRNAERAKSWRQYYPVQKTVTDWVPYYKVEYQPVERQIQDYVEIEHNVDYVPIPRYEKKIEYIPVEKYEQKVDYEPVYSTNYSGYYKNNETSRQYANSSYTNIQQPFLNTTMPQYPGTSRPPINSPGMNYPLYGNPSTLNQSYSYQPTNYGNYQYKYW